MKDEFDLNSRSDETTITNKDRFYNMLWYIPFINIRVLALEKQWEKEISKKFTKQWITLFILYIALSIIFGIFFGGKMVLILTLVYFLAILFFGIKAYNSIYVEISFLEKISDIFTQDSKKNLNKNKKNDDFK